MSKTSKTQNALQWTRLGAVDDFAPGSLTTIKESGQQLVVARTEDGELHVLDNRCPHEGYPLAQGELKGCALTCCWHNWKFDVRDGSCTLGGEGVRRFPSQVEDDQLWSDLRDPDPETFFPSWKASLHEGLRKHANGRAVRDGVRLLQGGYPAEQLLVDIARYDANFAEYGSTHTLALSADLMRVLDRLPGMEAMRAISQAIDMCGESNRRLPERVRPQPVAGGNLDSIRDAVENEEAEVAEALLLGAFDAGVTLEEIDRWMYACISDHFLSFGHPLIYLTKLQEMGPHLSREAARELYSSLLYSVVLETREDTLPYMHAYRARLLEVESELERAYAEQDENAEFDEASFRDRILDEKGPAAANALWDAIERGVPAPKIARALVAAAAHRFLRFDVALDSDYSVAEHWIWVTHRLTFASAVRNAVERFDSPDALRYLFQAVAFINSGRGMDLPPESREFPSAEPSNIGELFEAIEQKDSAAALARAQGILATERGFAELKVALEDALLQDGPVRPLVVTHLIKTAFCALEEYGALEGSADRTTPLLAVIRWLASPIRERRMQQVVRDSIAWVGHSEMPRKLTQ